MPIRKNRPTQDAASLLDAIIEHANLKNDAALARYLTMTPPQISKLRAGSNAVTGDTLLLIHDVTGLPIAQLRELMAVPDDEEALAATE